VTGLYGDGLGVRQCYEEVESLDVGVIRRVVGEGEELNWV